MRIAEHLAAFALGVAIGIVGRELLIPEPRVVTQELHDECNRQFKALVKATREAAAKMEARAKTDKRYASYLETPFVEPLPGDPCKTVGTVLD